MKIIVKTKNFSLTDALDKLIRKRMETMSKIINAFQESAELLIEVGKETNHHRKGDIFEAMAVVFLPRKKMVARAHGENLGKLVTAIKKELEREIGKYKTKIIDKPRREYRKTKK